MKVVTVFRSNGEKMEIVTVCTLLVLIIQLGYCEENSDIFPPLLNISKPFVDVPHRSSLTIECRGEEEVTWHYKHIESWKLGNADVTIYSKGNTALLYLPPSYVFTGLYTCSYKSARNVSLQRNASVYVFLNDPRHLFVPQTEFNTTSSIHLNAESHLYVPCLPTNSKINVTLWQYNNILNKVNHVPSNDMIVFDPTKGFLIREPLSRNFTCRGSWNGFQESTSIFNIEVANDSIPKPFIESNLPYWNIGDNNVLNCSVAVMKNSNFQLEWTYPHHNDRSMEEGDQQLESRPNYDFLLRTLNIINVEASHEGFYTCVLNGNNSMEVSKDHIYILVTAGQRPEPVRFEREIGTTSSTVEESGKSKEFSVNVTNYNLEDIEIHWEKNGLLIQQSAKYKLGTHSLPVTLTINNLETSDAGKYSLTGRRIYPYTFSYISFLLAIESKPSVQILPGFPEIFYEANKEHHLQCIVESYPLSSITWLWKNCSSWNLCDESGKEMIIENQSKDTEKKLENSMIKIESTLTVNAVTSGIYYCKANNSFGENNASADFIVTDITNGKRTAIGPEDLTITTNQEVKLYCKVTSFAYENITWSFIQVPGNYNMLDILLNELPGYNISKLNELTTKYSETSVLMFEASNNRSGLYGCTVSDKMNNNSLKDHFLGVFINIPTSTPSPTSTSEAGNLENNTLDSTIVTIISVIVVAVLLVIVTIIAVAVKIRRKNLKFNPYNFQAGQVSLINPNLPLEDQVELLPYDPRWEFPKDRLKIGRVIGHGAFGRVVKADAIGLESHVPYTTVAVKMLKDKNDESQYKSLMAELKIMIHLGRHVNILNLMGAVTKNIYKGELMVMVEYCCHGNLRSYLLKHREKFINQIDPKTGKVNQNILFEDLLESTEEGDKHRFDYSKPIALGISNPTYNYSSTGQLIRNTGSNGTDITGESSTSGTIGGETSIGTVGGSESGYSSTGEVIHFPFSRKEAARYSGILTTSDLLCYCFQCAQGMSYLASRKLLHRDLAARNILLAEGNVIKISDFGLSKDVYKYSKYVKKADGPLPVKWMAIESIRDRVFTIKSDVWSFGVLMWEIFTLGGNPYPGFEMNEGFFKRLQEGYRLEKPEYSPENVYDIMLDCWKSNPKDRPDFSLLGEEIGEMLGASVKEHYLELNGPYAELNNDLRSLEDYLNMNNANYLDMTTTSEQETNVDNTNLPVPDYLIITDLNSSQNQEKSPYYNIPPTIKEQDVIECSPDLENENARSGTSEQVDHKEIEKETPANLFTNIEKESSTDKNPDYLVMM